MNIRYEKDMEHNYIIFETKLEKEELDYRTEMLSRNAVPGLLPLHIRHIDDRIEYCYEISGKQSLDKQFQYQKLDSEKICGILQGLYKTIKELEKYLLSGKYLIVQPQYIYMNIENSEIFFCYYPLEEQNTENFLRELLKFILAKTDHNNPQTVLLAYGLFQEGLKENISLKDIILQISDLNRFCYGIKNRLDGVESTLEPEGMQSTSERLEGMQSTSERLRENRGKILQNSTQPELFRRKKESTEQEQEAPDFYNEDKEGYLKEDLKEELKEHRKEDKKNDYFSREYKAEDRNGNANGKADKFAANSGQSREYETEYRDRNNKKLYDRDSRKKECREQEEEDRRYERETYEREQKHYEERDRDKERDYRYEEDLRNKNKNNEAWQERIQGNYLERGQSHKEYDDSGYNTAEYSERKRRESEYDDNRYNNPEYLERKRRDSEHENDYDSLTKDEKIKDKKRKNKDKNKERQDRNEEKDYEKKEWISAFWMAIPFLTLIGIVVLFSGKVISAEVLWKNYPGACAAVLLGILVLNCWIVKKWYFEGEKEEDADA